MSRPAMSGRVGAALLLAGAALIAAAAPAGEPVGEPAGPFGDAATTTTRYDIAQIAPRSPCDALSADRASGATIVSATTVAAAADAPAFCRVVARIAPAIAIEVDLPQRWNARFYMMGNGGPAGEPNDDTRRLAVRARALRHGFIAASTNAGHDRSPDSYRFAADPQKLADYGSRAVHLTTVVARALARDFYGQPIRRSYWDSCSTGGREGLIEAQRYPEDFDGIVAGAPALDFAGLLLQHLWVQRIVDQTPLSLAKIHLVGRAVYAKCDARDGLADGLIADPEHCGFDVARDVPQCAATTTGDDACLTPAETAAFRRLYAGPTSHGRSVFPGLTIGAEPAAPSGRPTGWDVDAHGMAKGGIDVAESQLRNAVFHDPAYDWHRFDLDSDIARLAPLRAAVDATDPDLSRFARRGGKLLLYYGWADTTLNPAMAVRYFKAARTANGAGMDRFFRMFMVPGMFHCAGGYGPDRFDAISAVIDWVEAGKPPATLVATQMHGNDVVRTRPLCPYPKIARYRGTGAVDRAASFACTAPERRS